MSCAWSLANQMAYPKISITFLAGSIFDSAREFLHHHHLRGFSSSRTSTCRAPVPGAIASSYSWSTPSNLEEHHRHASRWGTRVALLLPCLDAISPSNRIHLQTASTILEDHWHNVIIVISYTTMQGTYGCYATAHRPRQAKSHLTTFSWCWTWKNWDRHSVELSNSESTPCMCRQII
jgi:hypothetical protein